MSTFSKARLRIILKDSLIGTFPETVAFVTAAPTTIGLGALSPFYVINHFREQATILPTIVAEHDPKSLKKASKEALKVYSNLQSKRRRVVDIHTHANVPLTNVKIIGSVAELDHSVFHVLSEDGYCLSMAKDVFTESVMNSPVENGVLKGSFVFAQVNSKVPQLVRVGSYLHKVVERSHERRDKPKLTSYEPGDVVVCKKGIRAVFLGYGKTKKASLSGSDFDFMYYEKKVHVFYVLSQVEHEKTVNKIKHMSWNSKVEFQTSPQFVEKIGKVELKLGMFAHIREFATKQFMRDLMEFAGEQSGALFMKLSKKELIQSFIEYCPSMCLSDVNELSIVPIDIGSSMIFM